MTVFGAFLIITNEIQLTDMQKQIDRRDKREVNVTQMSRLSTCLECSSSR